MHGVKVTQKCVEPLSLYGEFRTYKERGSNRERERGGETKTLMAYTLGRNERKKTKKNNNNNNKN